MTEIQSTINNLKEILTIGNQLVNRLEKAQKDLETPPRPQHKWKHGDVFETSTSNVMVYLKFTSKPPQTVCIEGICGGLVEPQFFNHVMENAKFLFNIKEKL